MAEDSLNANIRRLTKLTFPDRDNRPAGPPKMTFKARIASSISNNLRTPPSGVCLRLEIPAAGMAVPEAPMNKYNYSFTNPSKVRAARDA